LKLFLDSSALIARFNRRDQYHRKSLSVLEEISRETLPYKRMFTSNYVLDEAVTYTLLRTKRHSAAIKVLEAITGSDYIKTLWVTEGIQDGAIQLFKKYSDHVISITDCTTAVLMKENGIKTIFTFDHDFRVLGFDIIP